MLNRWQTSNGIMAREFDFVNRRGGQSCKDWEWVSASEWKIVRGERCQGGEGAGKGLVVFASCRSAGGCSRWGGDLWIQHLVSKITLAVALGRRMSDGDEGSSTRGCERVRGVVTEGKCSLKAPAQTRCQVVWFPIEKPKPRRAAEKQLK